MNEECAFKLDLLKQEMTSVQENMRAYGQIQFQVKGWAITVVTGGILFALDKNNDKLWMPLILVVLLFWILDALFKSIQHVYIDRATEIECFLQKQDIFSNSDVWKKFPIPNTELSFAKTSLLGSLISFLNSLFNLRLALLYIAMLAILQYLNQSKISQDTLLSLLLLAVFSVIICSFFSMFGQRIQLILIPLKYSHTKSKKLTTRGDPFQNIKLTLLSLPIIIIGWVLLISQVDKGILLIAGLICCSVSLILLGFELSFESRKYETLADQLRESIRISSPSRSVDVFYKKWLNRPFVPVIIYPFLLASWIGVTTKSLVASPLSLIIPVVIFIIALLEYLSLLEAETELLDLYEEHRKIPSRKRLLSVQPQSH
jgi:hypothetical protein